MHDNFDRAIAWIAFGFVIGATTIALFRVILLFKSPNPKGHSGPKDAYQDQDGTATEDSILTYSRLRSLVAAGLGTVLGLGSSIAALVLAAGNDDYNVLVYADSGNVTYWLDLALWVAVTVQLITLVSSSRRLYRWKSRQEACGLCSTAVVIASLILRSRLNLILNATIDSSVFARGLCWLAQLLAAITVFSALGSIPRRPDVFHKDKVVDQQYTLSLLSRFTYSWNAFIFDIARERQLEMADLPQLDHLTRSKNLHADFVKVSGKGRLWWRLVKHYRVQLSQQWILVLLDSTLALFPDYVMYNLLTRLELGVHDTESRASVASWSLALTLALIADNFIGTLLSWWTTSRLTMPLQAMLKSLVFSKALREHEIAAPPQRVEDSSNDAEAINDKDKKKGEAKSPTSKSEQARQSVINHMKMDTGRVGMFCDFNYWLPMSLVKLVLAGGFLIVLIGWKAVLAGLLAASATVPLNSWVSKKYGKIQFGLMKYRDVKAHLLTEALQGMRQIKFSALEEHWEKKILNSRDDELRQYFKASLFMALTILVINLGPVLLACTAHTVYAIEQGGNVRASVIFASLGLFDQLDEATALLPLLQVYMQEAWTSCVRLENYLGQPDKAPIADHGETIAFKDATIAWPKKEDIDEAGTVPTNELRSQLRDINLEFPPGKLSLITGKTGSGKSLLLAGILGEVKLVSGTVKVPPLPSEEELGDSNKSISYPDWIIPNLTSFVSQTPWIETGTIRENIMFGLPFDQSRYAKVCKACSLEQDIELLADGDETEVGPKGVTLSGGQKWRVALARSLYSRAGVLILDDVLSAVDAHVGRCMVDEALTGELAIGRTRILATHHAEMCLAHANYVVTLRDGKVAKAETVEPAEAAEDRPGHDISETSTVAGGGSSHTSEETTVGADPRVDVPEKKKNKKSNEEGRATGRVKWDVYMTYLKAGNAPFLWAAVLLFITGAGLTSIGRVWSFKQLSEQRPAHNSSSGTMPAHVLFATADTQHILLRPGAPSSYVATTTQSDTAQHSVLFWIGMSVVFYLASLVLGVLRSITMTVIGLRSSRKLFEKMVHAVLHAPLKWTDTVPAGRILNRFTSDTFFVDRRLPGELGNLLNSVFQLIITMVASLSVSSYVLVAGVLLIVVYVRIALKYITMARELKRINSVAHSPIYDQFSSVLVGLATIRAFNRTGFYMNRMFDLIDNNVRAGWGQSLGSRWMNFRLKLVGTLFVTSVALAVSFGHVDAALAGFSLTFALRYAGRLTGLLGSLTSVELAFNAAERIVEYANLETESEKGIDAPAAWPAKGGIEVDDLTVAYKDDSPPVLKHISFSVKPGERVGIVGRTGAGKSTLASVFFRLLNPRQGSVRIDDIDIATLKLVDLRSRLAIIPQDPFLFSGTLRSNLDIEDTKEDYELQTTLQRVHLARHTPIDSARPSRYPAASVSNNTLVTTTEATPLLADDAHATTSSDLETIAVPPPVSEETVTTITPSASDLAPIPTATTSSNNNDNDDDEVDSRDIFNNLSMEISTGGANLSQGQRQLVCLARSLLARPNIVIMDEATSAVDRATDAAIQTSLRDEFAASGCTVLVIAHRLSTVADFDKILVLKAGEVAEFGSPRELLEAGMRLAEHGEDADADDDGKDEEATGEGDSGGESEEDGKKSGTGVFYDLVQDSSEKDVLMRMILGEEGAAQAKE